MLKKRCPDCIGAGGFSDIVQIINSERSIGVRKTDRTLRPRGSFEVSRKTGESGGRSKLFQQSPGIENLYLEHYRVRRAIMPIYDYRCGECGKVSEILVRSSQGEVRCPHCGSGDMSQMVSASYSIRMDSSEPGTTCCGRTERCGTPPCTTGDTCGRR